MFNKWKSTLSSSVTNTIQNTVYTTGTIISGVIPGEVVLCLAPVQIIQSYVGFYPSVTSKLFCLNFVTKW